MLLLLGLWGCSTNPYTDRWQLQMLPQSYLNQLGAQSYLQVKNDPKVTLSKDPKEIEPVQRVAKRIIEVAKHSKYAETANTFEWEVNVIKDDKTLNAWALPGGKIAVYTGIFPIAKNEAGLAAIMGHEVVHALAGHGGERMSQGLVAQVLMTGAAAAVQTSAGPATGQAIMQALGAGAQVGVLLPFSRKHESEADYIGLLLAAQAGYDPQEAVRVWERMAQAGGSQPAEFLSTHPSHGTRIKQLQEWMPEALGYYQQAPHAPPAPDLPAIGRSGGAPGAGSAPKPQQLRKDSPQGQ
jgi:predicted Zn-dependent protease